MADEMLTARPGPAGPATGTTEEPPKGPRLRGIERPGRYDSAGGVIPLSHWQSGGLSVGLHGLVLALLLLAVSAKTPPEPAAPGTVAMVFAPATTPSPQLPEAVPTQAAPAPPSLAAAAPAETVSSAPQANAESAPALPAPSAPPQSALSPAPPETAVTARPPAELPAPSPPPHPARAQTSPRAAPPAPRKLATAQPFHPSPAPASGAAPAPSPPQMAPAPSGSAPQGPATPPASPPAPLSALVDPAPDYPQLALRRREQGDVILRVVVGPDGLPQTVEIERSSGHPDLDHAAQAAVQRWRFRPATQGGVPVTGTARVPIHFVISN